MEGRMHGKLNLIKQSVSQATAYRFVFDSGDWAVFTLNNETMELSINSSWGAYGYRWDAAGPSMARFVSRCSPDYVLGKFAYLTDPQPLRDVVDDAATRAEVEQQIDNAREACGIITESQAENLRDDLDSWESSEFSLDHCPAELSQFLPEYWRLVSMEKSATYRVLRDQLLPFFSKFLIEHVIGTCEENGKVVTP